MAENLPDLVTTAREINQRRWYDIVRTGSLAVFEIIPGLNTILDEFLPNWKIERLNAFLIDVADSIKKLEGKFNQQESKTVEYGLLLEHVAKQVTQTPSKAKLNAYRAILLNTCIPSPSNELERAYFLDFLNRLQEIHIILLSLFRDQYAFGKAHSSMPPTNMMTSCLRDTVSSYLKPLSIPDELMQVAIHDLDTMGILPGLHQSLNTMMTASGAKELSSRLKDFGRRFADFIALPREVASAE